MNILLINKGILFSDIPTFKVYCLLAGGGQAFSVAEGFLNMDIRDVYNMQRSFGLELAMMKVGAF